MAVFRTLLLVLAWLLSAWASASAMPQTGSDDRRVFACTSTQAAPLRFDNAIPSTPPGRGAMMAQLTVACEENTSYRVVLTSENDCRLLGPRSGIVRYSVFTDPAHEQAALDCASRPIELRGRGLTTFHLYALTEKIETFPSGNIAT